MIILPSLTPEQLSQIAEQLMSPRAVSFVKYKDRTATVLSYDEVYAPMETIHIDWICGCGHVTKAEHEAAEACPVECYGEPYLLDTLEKVEWANKYVLLGRPWRLCDSCHHRPAVSHA